MTAAEDFALTSPVAVGGRESHDHWPSPPWTTDALLRRLAWPDAATVVLDPCCGEGSILDVARARGWHTLGLELDGHRGNAARARGHRVAITDALATDWPAADLLITNPPYSHAETLIRRALAWQRRQPWLTQVCALLRLSWLEPTATRGELLRTSRPDVWVLPRRPMFDGKGHDSITSAWFCWPGAGRYEVLP